MTKSVLIIGYGRAGKRHAKLARQFGLTVYVFDPFIPAEDILRDGFSVSMHVTGWPDERLRAVFEHGQYDYAVIATPPKEHIEQILICLEAGVSVLCEKPLCAIGQLSEAKALLFDDKIDKVMVAYNWRYQPRLKSVQNTFGGNLFLDCWQYRPDLPEWGLLLDHVSHDLDILRFVATDELEIIEAKYLNGKTGESWAISTNHGKINEHITYQDSKRYANLYYAPGRFIELDPDPAMFIDLWRAFLRGDYRPGIREAIRTQELIERCYRLDKKGIQV